MHGVSFIGLSIFTVAELCNHCYLFLLTPLPPQEKPVPISGQFSFPQLPAPGKPLKYFLFPWGHLLWTCANGFMYAVSDWLPFCPQPLAPSSSGSPKMFRAVESNSFFIAD